MSGQSDGMNLDEYVRETLLAILGGVLDAQGDERCGPYVGRTPANTESISLAKDDHDNVVSTVDFDLATTVETKSGKGGSVGIKVVPLISLGAEARAEMASSAISRIAFSVPISIPKPEGQRADDAERSRRINEAMRSSNRGISNRI